MLSPTLKRLLWAALLALTLTGAPALASGPDQTAHGENAAAAEAATAEVTVRVIHATKADGGVDAPLENIGRYLVRSFKGFKSFKQLSTQTSKLAKGTRASVKLPNNTALTYTYEGTDSKGFLNVHIDVGGMKSTVSVRDGGTFFQAGRTFRDGLLVLAVGASIAR